MDFRSSSIAENEAWIVEAVRTPVDDGDGDGGRHRSDPEHRAVLVGRRRTAAVQLGDRLRHLVHLRVALQQLVLVVVLPLRVLTRMWSPSIVASVVM